MKSRLAKHRKYVMAMEAARLRQRIAELSRTFPGKTRSLADADGQEHVIYLSQADVSQLVMALEHPPQPNKRLQKAFAAYRARMLSPQSRET